MSGNISGYGIVLVCRFRSSGKAHARIGAKHVKQSARINVSMNAKDCRKTRYIDCSDNTPCVGIARNQVYIYICIYIYIC